ncbi:MAG: hypothetical protein HN689_03485 [Euryarchaeota archaeon]|jgi:hypothetical protein|nr:hypothetical protein [Euryarchaeota archaeon]
MKDNFHINQELALFAVIGVIVVLFWRKPNSKKSRNVRVQQIFAKPPSAFGVFFAKTIILAILIISASALIEYSTNIADYEEIKCDSIEHNHHRQCNYEQYTSNDFKLQLNGFLLTPEVDLGVEVGDELPHTNSPDGPWFWTYYIAGCLVLTSGFSLAKKRRKTHASDMMEAESNLRPIIRRLALDPTGVVEGRIALPEPVSCSKTGRKETRRIVVIYFFSAFMMITTLLSVYDYFYRLDSEMNMVPKHDFQASILAIMALAFVIAANISIKYLSATYSGEDDSMIPNILRNQQNITKQSEQERMREQPVSAKDVLEELAKEMRAARRESELLRGQLAETKIKLSDLEGELEKKTIELEGIQAVTVDMERIIQENEQPGNKNLSLMDSVMVGDNLFNGDKIDQQIVNDPKAIAKAAIEAYKAGRKDLESIEFDF